MLKFAPKRHFGLLQGFKKIWSVPKNHLQSIVTPTGGNNNMLQNATTLFDDVAQEFSTHPIVQEIVAFIRAGGKRTLCTPGDRVGG